MRILIVSQYFYPENFIINDLAERLALQGNDVVVLTGKPNYPSGKFADGYKSKGIDRETYRDVVKVIRVPILPRRRGSIIDISLNYMSFLLSASVLAHFALKNEKFELIFFYGVSPITSAVPAILIKNRFGGHLAIWIQDLWPESLRMSGFIKNPRLLSFLDRVVKWIYNSADTLLVQSKSFGDHIGKYTDPSKIFYYPNFAPVFPDGDISLPAALEDVMAQRFSLVYGGNLGKVQSLPTIIGAARLLESTPAIQIVIAGSGSEEDWLRRSVEEAGLRNIRLVGQLTPRVALALFRRSDALLLTLRGDEALSMTIPSKLQTYMKAEKPVIASAGGETARIVEASGAGFVAQPESPEKLARAILRMYQTSAAERKMMGGRAGAYYARHFEAVDPAELLVEITGKRIRGTA